MNVDQRYTVTVFGGHKECFDKINQCEINLVKKTKRLDSNFKINLKFENYLFSFPYLCYFFMID